MTGLSLGFVGWTLSGHLSGFQALTVTARGWWWLVLGLAASWLSLVINAIAWRVLVAWLGSRTEDLALVPLYLRTNLLKYLPGGIWHFVERLRTLQSSIGVNRALGSVLLEPLVMAVAALLWVPFGGWQSGLAPLCLLPSLVLLPRIREPLLRRLEQAKWEQMQRAEPGALDHCWFTADPPPVPLSRSEIRQLRRNRDDAIKSGAHQLALAQQRAQASAKIAGANAAAIAASIKERLGF